ncbi:MAG TPA: MDR family MFS transporter [Mycobacteriales bacterium]|nr:MDR family MFS transporter [Mycobacteriales bacterium]
MTAATEDFQDPTLPPGGFTLTRRQLIMVFAGLMSGMLLAALDQTIVATALPTIVGDLGGLSHLSWVVTSYLLASTVSTPLWGKLGDLYGRKLFFQAAIVIFLLGSALSGVAQDMGQLIGFRAMQGLGAGGLIVGAQAIIGAVVSPRERGKYMGLIGSVFAVSSVAGPLIGGVFTEHLTWRWVFYINLPIGAVALAVVAAALPSREVHVRHTIDYAGAALLGAAATALILAVTWGGNTYAWDSATIIGLLGASVVLVVGFVLVERRSPEPLIPLNLFGSSIFRVASTAGGVVGFSMFGAITFLPLFLQTVHGAGPTESGLQMVPIMALVLVMSVWSGRRISATGRYRAYPIAGTIIMTFGIFLLSRLGVSTPYWKAAVYMAIVGAGLGLTMQVMVLAVQNSVPFRDLGTATSAATFFRSIGGSIGVAVFGTIYANRLAASLPDSLRHQGGASAHFTPERLKALAAEQPAVFAEYLHAFDHALHVVFLSAVPFAAIGIVLALLLREVPLRNLPHRSAGMEAAESQAMPQTAENAEAEAEAERLTGNDPVSPGGSPAAGG